MNNELITDTQMSVIAVKQLPVIEEQLQTVSEIAKNKVKEATALVASEENIKAIKSVRAALNKEFKEFEEARKNAKNMVMQPYSAFEERYKILITDVYRPADAELDKKIASVEDAIKGEKESALQSYFLELSSVEGLGWLSYERAGIKVTLSASAKSLKEQVKGFVEKVKEDVIAIEAMPDSADIMAEYKSSLNIATAIATVTARRAAIEEEKNRMAAIKAKKENEAKMVGRVEQYCTPEKPVEDEHVYSVLFTVKGTKAKLKQLKEFLKDGGYDYEC